MKQFDIPSHQKTRSDKVDYGAIDGLLSLGPTTVLSSSLNLLIYPYQFIQIGIHGWVLWFYNPPHFATSLFFVLLITLLSSKRCSSSTIGNLVIRAGLRKPESCKSHGIFPRMHQRGRNWTDESMILENSVVPKVARDMTGFGDGGHGAFPKETVQYLVTRHHHE